MTVRRRVVGRHEDGRKIVVTFGDEMCWKYDHTNDVFHVVSPDGKAKYAVARSRPTGADKFGHKWYRYWMARVIMDGETINLGDTYLVAFEGKEVCQIYESARHEAKPIEAKPIKLKSGVKWLLPRVNQNSGSENS